jgi:hypothetical protein
MCNRTDLLKRWQQSTKAIGGFSQSQPRVPLTTGIIGPPSTGTMGAVASPGMNRLGQARM